ncbi:low affinity immunoglobulin epsilon Fc receptor-like [Drosophila takahashii]|uniref:low affinity immunoglobulin epsilon Fc receptor-like n=1 Tax=Drosophila takahashii TaxID=29030 RepID=UPI001CF84330|nr:low affinity immunoglobulin epsilon Fc receptor-like [Drosophila takahashii]
MEKLAYLFLGFLLTLANCQDNNGYICALSDPANQCGQFCLSQLHPVLNMIPETEIKLDRIQEEQQIIQERLQAVQFWLQVQWTIIKGNLKEMTPEVFEARLNETEKQLLALISETKIQFNGLQNMIKEQKSVIQSQLDGQLLEVQAKLDKQNQALEESCKRAPASEDFERIFNRTEGHLQDLLKPLDSALKNQLQLLQTKMESQMVELKSDMGSQFAALQDSLKAKLQVLPAKMEEQQAAFQQIGTRYFYIENKYKLNWVSAASTCRKMGGHLASIKDQRELNVLEPKLNGRYWLGTNDREKEGQFVSEASGKKPYLKWWPGEPNDLNGNEDCVQLDRGLMNDIDCARESYFICQSDNEI